MWKAVELGDTVEEECCSNGFLVRDGAPWGPVEAVVPTRFFVMFFRSFYLSFFFIQFFAL